MIQFFFLKKNCFLLEAETGKRFRLAGLLENLVTVVDYLKNIHL